MKCLITDLPNRPKNVLQYAGRAAMEMGHSYIASEHIFLGLTMEKNSIAYEILNSKGITSENAFTLIAQMVGTAGPASTEPSGFTSPYEKDLRTCV